MEERNLWPSRGLNLECPKPKYFNCQVTVEFKICVKGYKYELYKIPRQHSRMTTCIKNRRCDACAQREENCQCVRKKYCTIYAIKKEKCANYKELPPKCTTNSNSFLN